MRDQRKHCVFLITALEIAEKQAKKKGNAALSSLMKHINFSASKSHEEGFTIGVGEHTRLLATHADGFRRRHSLP